MFPSDVVSPAASARGVAPRSLAPLDAALLLGRRHFGPALRELVAVPEHAVFANAQPGAELYPLRPDPRCDPVEARRHVTKVIVSDARLGIGPHVRVSHAEHVLVDPVYAPKADHVVLPRVAVEVHLDGH